MFTIAICSGFEETRKTLKYYLESLEAEGLRLRISNFKHGFALKEHYSKQKTRFDLIITGMKLPGCDGLSMSRFIRQYDTQVPIVVVSADSQYAVDCYDIGACAYIVKPVDKQKFLGTVRRLWESFKARPKDFFRFRNEAGWQSVRLEEIYYFESTLRHLKLKTASVEKDFVERISSVEQALNEKLFCRIHKSYIVNLAWVKAFRDDYLLLENGEKLPVSKHRKRTLREKWLRFQPIK